MKTIFWSFLAFILPLTLLAQRQAVYQYSTTTPYRLFYSLDDNKNVVGWKPDKVAFYAFDTPVSGTTPVYQYHAEKPMRFMYSTSPDLKSGWKKDGIAFYAPDFQLPESVPVYEFSSENPQRFLYSTSKNNGKGWTNQRVVFWAYLNENPKVEVIALQDQPQANPVLESSIPVATEPSYDKDLLELAAIPLPKPERIPEKAVTSADKPIISIADDKPQTIPVYEYSADRPARYNYSKVEQPDQGWEKINVAFRAYQYDEKGSIPIYRYYALNPWRFFYSADPNLATGDSKWKKDWIAFYAYENQVSGTIPVYQYYAQDPLRYMYSTNPNMSLKDWTLEKVAFYAFPEYSR